MDYGLIGKSLPHSFSPLIHKSLWGADYSLCELSEKGVSDFFESRDFKGVNVTIPYKKTAFDMCDVLSENAKNIGSVNTVINKNGILYGYNTDFQGLLYSLKRSGISLENKKVVILGSGATSKTAYAAAEYLNAASVSVVSRNGILNYRNVYELTDTEIIINTTPVGMYPDNDRCLVDLSKFKKLKGVMDVVYNPLRTRLISDAKNLGLKTADGLSMLAAQGVYAAKLFTGNDFTEDDIEKQIGLLYDICENIVLIGMPGCGKTSVGSLIAKKTGRRFYDIDAEIEKREGKTVPEIFKENGEEYFRNIEAQTVRDVSKNTGCVIATGGGCVLNPENILRLKQNGRVFLIERDISLLPLTGRPLSKDFFALKDMENKRLPLYRGAADEIVKNNGGDFTVCAERIWEKYENTRDKRS